eukprot:Hpha_TRINITY_DN15328_c4_g5::TRINITY_DN15328_c4_g5_i1::g.88179::m.88179
MAGRRGRAPGDVPVNRGAPADFQDPELRVDKLPQPYRLVDKLINGIIETAMERAEGATKVATERVYTDPLGLKEAVPYQSATVDGVCGPHSLTGTDMFFGRADGRFERFSAPLRMQTLVSQPLPSGESVNFTSPAGTLNTCVAAASDAGVHVVCFPPPAPRERRSRSSTLKPRRRSSAAGSIDLSARASVIDLNADLSEEERQMVVCFLPREELGGGEIVSLVLSDCASYLAVGVQCPPGATPRAAVHLYKVPKMAQHYPRHNAGDEAPVLPPPPAPVLITTVPAPGEGPVVPQLTVLGSPATEDTPATSDALLIVWLGQCVALSITLRAANPRQEELLEEALDEAEVRHARVAAVEPPSSAPAPPAGKGRKQSVTQQVKPDGPGRRPQIAPVHKDWQARHTLQLPGAVTAATLNATQELVAFGCMGGVINVHRARGLSLVLSVSVIGPERIGAPRTMFCFAVSFWRRKYVIGSWGDDAHPEASGTVAVCDLTTREPACAGDHVEVGGDGEWRHGSVVTGGDPMKVYCEAQSPAGLAEEIAVPQSKVRRPALVGQVRFMPIVRSVQCPPHLPIAVLFPYGLSPRVYDFAARRIICNLVVPPRWCAFGCGVDQGFPLYNGSTFAVVAVAIAASAGAARALAILEAAEAATVAAAAAKPAPKGKAAPPPKGGAQPPPAQVSIEAAKARATQAVIDYQQMRLLSLLRASVLGAAAVVHGPEEMLLCGVEGIHVPEPTEGDEESATPPPSWEVGCFCFTLHDIVNAAYPTLGATAEEYCCQLKDLCKVLLTTPHALRLDPTALKERFLAATAALRPVEKSRKGSMSSLTGTRRTRMKDTQPIGGGTLVSRNSPELSATSQAGGTRKFLGDTRARVEFAEGTTTTSGDRIAGLTAAVSEEIELVNDGLAPIPGPREVCMHYLLARKEEQRIRKQRVQRYLTDLQQSLR